MRFHIVVIEPQGYRYAHFLYDIVKLVAGGLEQAGHETSLGRNQVDQHCINIVIGGHLLRRKEELTAFREHVPAYVVVQTEILNLDGVNDLKNQGHLDAVYLPLLRGALRCWDLSRTNLARYESWGLQGRWLQPGWVPDLEDVPRKVHKDLPFLFYGSTTKHRVAVIKGLRERGHEVCAVYDPVAMYRNDLIGRARVQLVPRQGGRMGQLPWTRILHQVHNHAVPVVEACDDQAWLEDLFLTAPQETYLDFCEEVVARTDLDDQAALAYERLRARPMARIAEWLVDDLNVPAAA